MSALDDVDQHLAHLWEKYGDQDLPDIGGRNPVDRLKDYQTSLLRARADDAAGRGGGSLGWDTLLIEEVLEVITASSNEERYAELIDLAGGALAYAEVVKLRKNH